MVEQTNSNLWTEWFPESALADVLSGRKVVANIGQVNGVWKRALEREVRAGRLAKWRGKWFPIAGAPVGLGNDKDCYGRPEHRDFFAEMKRGISQRAEIA